MQSNLEDKNGATQANAQQKSFEQGLAEILASFALETPLFQGSHPVYLRPFVDPGFRQQAIAYIATYARNYFKIHDLSKTQPPLAPAQTQDSVLAKEFGGGHTSESANPSGNVN